MLGEGREGFQQIIRSCGLPEAIELGAQGDRVGARSAQGARARPTGPLRRGVGMAIVMQASGIPGVDMGAASIKMNEDASFNLLMGATDIGTGSDTMFCQVAAEALGVPVEKIIPYSSDTDMTPFDPGAYASSTTYISGRAVEKAARAVREQIIEVGARMLEEKPEDLVAPRRQGLRQGRPLRHLRAGLPVVALPEGPVPDHGHARRTCPTTRRRPSPPCSSRSRWTRRRAWCACCKVVEAVDCGQVVNPQMAEGQVEGAAVQSAGLRPLRAHALRRRTGRMQFRSFRDYTIATAIDVPGDRRPSWSRPTSRPGPFGAKAIAEIPINGPAPAIANAVFHATGVRIRDMPLTPDRVLAALRAGPRTSV